MKKQMYDLEQGPPPENSGKPVPTVDELVSYLHKNIQWLSGVADALDNPRLVAGVHSIKRNLMLLLESIDTNH